MGNSIFIAKLLGPIFAATGLSLMINRKVFNDLAAQLLNNAGAIIFLGMLTLLTGLTIVNTHNIWRADWTLIITIFGWTAVAAGLARILLPQTVQKMGTGLLKMNNLIHVTTIIWIGVGFWLCYKGYIA